MQRRPFVRLCANNIARLRVNLCVLVRKLTLEDVPLQKQNGKHQLHQGPTYVIRLPDSSVPSFCFDLLVSEIIENKFVVYFVV